MSFSNVSNLSSANRGNHPIGIRYWEPAIGEFSLDDHPSKSKVQNIMLSIAPLLKLSKSPEGISAVISGYPTASLSNPYKIISDYWNQGPFIDCISYSFYPKQVEPESEGGIVCQLANGNALIKQHNVTTEEASSFSNALMPQHLLQAGFDAVATSSSLMGSSSLMASSSIRTEIPSFEYEPITYLEGEHQKRIFHYSMKKCFDGQFSRLYDVTNIDSLKQSQHGQRLGWSLGIPLFGLIALKTCNDWLYSFPTDAAKSLALNDWVLDYSLEGISKVEFDWTTEVRTVFATLTGPDQGCHYNHINWIKTVHQIKKIVSCTINDDGIKQDSVRDERAILCLDGLDQTTYEKKIKTGDQGYTPCTEDQLAQFISPL